MKTRFLSTGWVVTGILLGALHATAVRGGDDTAQAAPPSAKYVFFFIGDGMGPNQRALAAHYLRGSGGGAAGLAMDALPVRAEVGTANSEGTVTDSAAAATALAGGVKTRNTLIGAGPDGKAIRSVAAEAAARGMSVGILTDVPANHATPAGFYGVSSSRYAYAEIAMQLPSTGYEFFAGSGIQWDLKDPAGDDFFAAAAKAGYAIAVGPEELAALPAGGKAVAVWSRKKFDADFYIDALGGFATNRIAETMIVRYVAAAIERLSADPDGFFIMAEGGRIDKAGHVNDSSASVMETLALDAAVRLALAFRDAHPRDTLVVVTADHETGGLTLAPDVPDAERVRILSARTCTAQALALRVDKARAAAGGASFAAVSSNLVPYADLGVLPPQALEKLRVAWEGGQSDADTRPAAAPASAKPSAETYGGGAGFALRIVAALDKAAGIQWSKHDHTGVDVPLTAVGVGAERFAGRYPNTGVPERILALLPPPRKVPSERPDPVP